MLSRVSRLRSLVRFYGFEDPKEKWTKNWWHYAESDVFGDETPEERGYQLAPYEKENGKNWDQMPRVSWQVDHDKWGINPKKFIDKELRDNHLGDYDPKDQTLSVAEIKTRIIHILRHFEAVDLRKVDWKQNILTGLKMDEFDRVALLTSIEHEFTTVFEDDVFDSFNSLLDVVKYLASDRYVI